MHAYGEEGVRFYTKPEERDAALALDDTPKGAEFVDADGEVGASQPPRAQEKGPASWAGPERRDGFPRRRQNQISTCAP